MVVDRSHAVSKMRRGLQAVGRARREIAALYLFGSSVAGTTGPLSDLDVAVLVREPRRKSMGRLDQRLALMGDIGHACRRSDVDVVTLNEAPPLLAYEVVTHGTILYERDHQARVAFEARTLQRYLDLRPFLATARAYLKRDLIDGTYGG